METGEDRRNWMMQFQDGNDRDKMLLLLKKCGVQRSKEA